MEYISCIYINHGLSFSEDKIQYCTTGNINNEKKMFVIEDDYTGNIIWDKLFDYTEEIKDNLRQGIVPDCCKGCLWLKKKDWDKIAEPRKLKYILFTNYTNCNSVCVYCGYGNRPYTETYNIVPLIQSLIDGDHIYKDALIEFAGGEPTVYPHFNDALNVLIDNNFSNITIFTNAIIFSEQIARALNKGFADIVVSIDAGSEEVHKKVKGVSSYNNVWNNLEKYNNSITPGNESRIKTKFIITLGYNDSEEEIYNWVMKCKKINIKYLILQADDCIFKTKSVDSKILEKLVSLADFFVNLTKQENCEYLLYTNIVNSYDILGKKYELCSENYPM